MAFLEVGDGLWWDSEIAGGGLWYDDSMGTARERLVGMAGW